MDNISSPRIDLEKIINGRSGKNHIPHFLIVWAKKFLHEDFINGGLEQGYVGVDFCENCIKYLGVHINVEGMENLNGYPQETRFTFVSNHPLGGIDGISLGMVFGRRFNGKIKYLVNDFLMNLKGLAPLCVPVNMIGGQSRDLPAKIDEAFSSENHVILFPSGLCSRKIDGIIQDRAWGKAFINKSVQNGRYVVPVHFIGQNSNRFYRIAKLCKMLKLKFNFAMLCLPDELYRGRNKTYTIKIGTPIPSTTFDSTLSAYDWAQWVRAKVYSL